MGNYESKVAELENAGWPDVPDWAKDYPFVYMWEAHSMRSANWFIRSQVSIAHADNAPKNATFKTGNAWHVIDECRNPRPFREMGLPVPDRLNYELKFNVHLYFENEKDRDALEKALTTFMQRKGFSEPLDFHSITAKHNG